MYNLALLHILVSLLYGLLGRRRGQQEMLVRFLVVLFLPGAGLFLMVMTNAYKRTAEQNENQLKLESEALMLGEEARIFRRPDLAKEMNVVSAEEILLVNDTSTRRKMLIDALKEQTIWQIRTLEIALQNEDTETVHYAAAALTQMRGKLQLQLQDLSVKYEANKQDIDVLKAYANVLKTYLNSSLLDERTYLKYTYTYSFVLESLLAVYTAEEMYYVDKINCDLTNKAYEKAREYCDKFQLAHPDSDVPYVMSLKISYTLRKYDEFTAEMERLKSSSVRVSHSTLMLIRHWSRLGSTMHEEIDLAFKQAAAGSTAESSSIEMGEWKK
ncbi:hypothetical protein [Brevibacillus centrosporus]|uniref:hypothetical protein n=1 Tax=Brevibacillus centrosporus TaxID=54910 RepID=UPI003824E6CD